MRTVIVDIINEKALDLLKELELLKLIRLRKDKSGEIQEVDWTEYKGAMSKQTVNEVDEQLKKLRKDWE